MSDHPNLHRASGTSGRGLLIAGALIVALVGVLALVGGAGNSPDAGDSAITPAQQPALAPTD